MTQKEMKELKSNQEKHISKTMKLLTRRGVYNIDSYVRWKWELMDVEIKDALKKNSRHNLSSLLIKLFPSPYEMTSVSKIKKKSN
jgi:hypothetical protein